MGCSRLTIFAGHYGSGKTNLAVNYAFTVKHAYPGCRVILADLDIVNPYFRSIDSEKILKRQGIEVIASRYANSNLEAPSMPSEAMAVFADKNCYGIFDVGGDDRGAYAIGRYAEIIEAEKADILLVCNKYRPLSRTPGQVLTIKNEIEAASRIRFTGIVNNSNLCGQTSPDDILSSAGYINEVSALSGLPIVFTAVIRELAEALPGIPALFPISIYRKEEWKIE